MNSHKIVTASHKHISSLVCSKVFNIFEVGHVFIGCYCWLLALADRRPATLVGLSGKHNENHFFLDLDLFNQYTHKYVVRLSLLDRRRRSLPTPLLHLQSSFAYSRLLLDSDTNRFLFVLLGVGRILLLNHLDYQVHFLHSPPLACKWFILLLVASPLFPFIMQHLML